MKNAFVLHEESALCRMRSWIYRNNAGIRACAVCVFFFACTVYLAAFAYNSLGSAGRYTPDSVNYINTAEVFQKTGSVSTSFCDLREAVKRDALPPVPVTGYTPLYPVLIAGAALVMKPAEAALVVTFAGYGLLLAAVFCLMRRLAEPGTALLATAALLHFAPLALVAVHAWSETVALFWLAVFLFMISEAREDGHRRFILAAAIAGGLAFLTRMAMLPVVLVGLAALARRGTPGRTVGNLALFAGAFLLFAVPVFVRRHAAVMVTTVSADPLRVLGEIGSAVWRSLIPGHWFAHVLYALLFVLAALFALRTRGTAAAPHVRGSIWILPLWSLVYLGFLACSSMRMPLDTVGERLAVPATFALLLFLVALFAAAARPSFWLCATFALLLAGTAALSELQSARWIARSKLPSVYEFSAQRRQWETLAWLERNVGPRDVVIAEDGMDLPLFLGPMKILYFFSTDRTTVSQDDLVRFLGRHRHEYEHAYLVLKIPEESAGNVPVQSAAGWIVSYTNTPPMVRLKDGLVYTL